MKIRISFQAVKTRLKSVKNVSHRGAGEVVGIACVVLFLLYVFQYIGTNHLGWAFSPIVLAWLLFNTCIGIYNAVHWYPGRFPPTCRRLPGVCDVDCPCCLLLGGIMDLGREEIKDRPGCLSSVNANEVCQGLNVEAAPTASLVYCRPRSPSPVCAAEGLTETHYSLQAFSRLCRRIGHSSSS